MNHDDPTHLSTAHRALTGHLAPTPHSDAAGPSPNDWPHLGSLVAKVRPSAGSLPPAVTMPWTVAHPAAPGGKAPGQHGGWLGKALRPVPDRRRPERPGLPRRRPRPARGDHADRLDDRRALLATGDHSDAPDRPRPWDDFQARALDSLTSAEAAGAFQIDREDPRLRDRYGRNIHGQCLLLARRLVEAGVGLVTVNWHDDQQNFWDTHGDNFNQLKNRLMPPADRGFAALLDDLDARGLLDETLVVWVGEFGRNPTITAANAGREHWPRCYSAALAGGGIARRPGPRGLRPLGRLPGPRPRQPRRPRRHDPPRPRHRPGHRGPPTPSADRCGSTAAGLLSRCSPDLTRAITFDGRRSRPRERPITKMPMPHAPGSISTSDEAVVVVLDRVATVWLTVFRFVDTTEETAAKHYAPRSRCRPSARRWRATDSRGSTTGLSRSRSGCTCST